MEPNYFTCTLGQAVHHQHENKTYETINEFIDFKAEQEPTLPAVGFYSTKDKSLHSHVLTFRDIRQGSIALAEALSLCSRKSSSQLASEPPSQRQKTVALLCPSSPAFLFTWLGLIRLGHAVLLIAPQCSPSAIAHLCRTCGVTRLFYHETYRQLAELASKAPSKLSEGEASITPVSLRVCGDEICQVIKKEPSSTLAVHPLVIAESTDVAYLHHTSGTSMGVPKPIPQSHRAAVGVLPTTLDGTKCATFTTTPLYHGGIADLFRAWTSNALIWLFPGDLSLPVTAGNICKCLDVASASSSNEGVPETRYFSSVPYVLQMMAEDRRGLEALQRMDIVGVGGAALPEEIGDKLVGNNVNLISRFGSAECGFLMSSHREFEKDQGWQYQRSSPGQTHLTFEQREDGLSELVIKPGWPHMAKRNREDGSYATADLFAPHPTIPDAWRYHSRADSQLTLITGKKFDPAPLEDAIRAARSGLVDDVLVFGNARPYPGALLFRSADVEGTSDRHVLNEISPTVERLNAESQSHARIPRNMLIPMPHDRKGLEKSSKGTVLRRTAEERYTDSIAAAYVDNRTSSEEIPDDQVSGEIRRIVTSVVSQNHSNDNNPSTLTDDTDLFAYGVDSVASIQIRQAISRLVPGQSVLPLNVVEDAGSISRLTRVVLQMRSGGPVETDGAVAAQHQLMLDLVKEYGVFNDRERPRSSPTALAETETEETTSDRNTAGIQVLLSGPTGSLGSHILHQLLSDRRVSKVHLLVRGASPGAARERVLKALSDRRLSVPDFDRRTVVWQCNKLSEASLGLSGDDYQHLARSVDVIVHLAWSVNFLLPLRSFATHLTGLRNLLNLALSAPTPPAFIFCSSVAAISNCQTTVPEEIVSDPCVSGPTGYARSKWVAEAVCGRAHEDTPLRGRVSVARVGQLSGASDTGMWSRTEAYPLMLSSVAATGVLPALKGEVLNWLPVDVAARAFVEDALLADTRDKGEEDGMEGSKAPGNGGGTAVPVHHVLNDDHGVRWTDLLAWLSRRESFQVVAVDEWLARLSNLPDDQSESKHHPALRLLGFWKSAYGQRRPEPTKGTHVARAVGEDQGRQAQSHLDHDERVSPTTEYDMSRTRARMPSLRSCPRVDGPYMRKLWAWIKENV